MSGAQPHEEAAVSVGAVVDEAISVAGSTPLAIAQRVTLAMTQTSEYRTIDQGDGELRFSRSYRPGWGLSLVEKTEQCLVHLEQHHGQVVVRLSGRILPDRLSAVRAAAAGRSVAAAVLDDRLGAVPVIPPIPSLDPVGSPAAAGGSLPPPPAAPVLAAPSRSILAPPAVPSSTPLAPPAPVPAPVTPSTPHAPVGTAPLPLPHDATVVRPSRGGPPAPRAWAVRLVLASGSSIPIGDGVVLGRDPVPPVGVNVARLPIEDPARSISKTHALVLPSAEGVLVRDLHSTNGTRVEDVNGRTVVVPAGGELQVVPGTRISLGDIEISLERIPPPATW